MATRYDPGDAPGTSTIWGSIPGAVARQPGICRTTLGPGITIPHPRPEGSTTAMYAGECMPKRSEFGCVAIGAGAPGGAPVGVVFCWPAFTTTVCPCALMATLPSVTRTVVSPLGRTVTSKPVPRTAATADG